MVGGGDSECSGGTSQTSEDEKTIFARGDEGDGKREDTEGGESDFEDDRGGEQVTESAGKEELRNMEVSVCLQIPDSAQVLGLRTPGNMT